MGRTSSSMVKEVNDWGLVNGKALRGCSETNLFANDYKMYTESEKRERR